MKFICKECLKNMRGGECTLEVPEMLHESTNEKSNDDNYTVEDWLKERENDDSNY